MTSPTQDTNAIGFHMFLQAVGAVYACYAFAYALWRFAKWLAS